MRKSIKNMFLLFASVLFMSIMACEEKSPKEKIKDGMEEVGEGVKEAGEDAKDKIDEGIEEVKDEVDDNTDDK